jgi:hypothetical protein
MFGSMHYLGLGLALEESVFQGRVELIISGDLDVRVCVFLCEIVVVQLHIQVVSRDESISLWITIVSNRNMTGR